MGVRKANNQPVATRGLLTATAGPDLMHTIPLNRTVRIRKIMWSNHTGANITLIFGTQTTALGWMPLFPTIECINGFDGELEEELIPAIEFALDATAGAAGVTGNIFVQASAVGILVRLEVEEFGS